MTAPVSFRGTALSNASVHSALPHNGSSGFSIFRDGAESTHAPESQDGWNDFGTDASRKKENSRIAVPWKGETIPMSASVPAIQSSRMEVFRDEVR